jgi:hypothetical protein
MFGQEERFQSDDEPSRGDHVCAVNHERERDAVSRAIELAERALEEASRARQDWSAVGRAAAELARLAERLGGLQTGAQTRAQK